jgi:hypothetical protein
MTYSYTCTILFICTTLVRNPTKWDFIQLVGFHLA